LLEFIYYSGKFYDRCFSAAEKGMLNQYWQKYLDLDNKNALKQLGNVLFGIGFAKDAVSTLAVAAIVVIGRIGLKAFCKDYGNNT
jgi:hypothetical protein